MTLAVALSGALALSCCLAAPAFAADAPAPASTERAREAAEMKSAAISLENMGRVDAAIRAYQNYLETAPDAPDAASIRAHIHELQNRPIKPPATPSPAPGTPSASAPTATATPSDPFGTALRSVLDARRTGFASMKGTPRRRTTSTIDSEFETTQWIPGAKDCHLSDGPVLGAEYECDFTAAGATEQQARTIAADLVSRVRRVLPPDWQESHATDTDANLSMGFDESQALNETTRFGPPGSSTPISIFESDSGADVTLTVVGSSK